MSTAHTGHDIGWAVKQMHDGQKVRRAGWNGEGICLFLVKGYDFTIEAHLPIGDSQPDLVGKRIYYHAHVVMRTSQQDYVPWLCSQTDLLAIDWELAE
jgi:hypothetical protein